MIESDWEGPWVVADHAYEVAKMGIPQGDKIFAGISEYDDYLSYLQKKENYEPGDTLALIAPFFIAFGVNEQLLIRVAHDNANFIGGAIEAIRLLNKPRYNLKIVSTSYCQFVHYTTSLAGIPRSNTKCTKFQINNYSTEVTEEDKKWVRLKSQDVAKLPKLGISASTNLKDISEEALDSIHELDHFFWDELPRTSYGQILKDIKPIGGKRKLDALRTTLEEEREELHNAVVIGDSITDWIMLRETKEAGGLAVAFNGNAYAVKNANLAILSYNCMITPIIIDLFRNCGLEHLSEVVQNLDSKSIKQLAGSGKISQIVYRNYIKFFETSDQPAPSEIVWITKENVDATIEKSKAVRNSVRGIAVGSLG